MPLQVVGQVPGSLQDSFGGFGRQGQQAELIGLAQRCGLGRFLQHHVGIGAAHAKRADGRAANYRPPWPCARLGLHRERRVGQVDLRIGPAVVQRAGDDLAVHRQRGLDQAQHTSGGHRVAQVALDGADLAELLVTGVSGPGPAQGGDLDGVA